MVEAHLPPMAAAEETADPLRVKLACDRIIRGFWAPMMFAAGEVSAPLLDVQIPMQDRLVHGARCGVDVARQLGRDRGTLHKNREDGAHFYEGPPSADARGRMVLNIQLHGPGAPVPLEAHIDARGEALEWPSPNEVLAREMIRTQAQRWADEGRITLTDKGISAGSRPLVDEDSPDDRLASFFEALPGLHPALAGSFRGEEGHMLGHMASFFSPEDALAMCNGVSALWQELGIAPKAPWEIPPSQQGEYVVWNARFVTAPVDEDVTLTREIAALWLRPMLVAMAPVMARALGHVDLLLDGARRIVFEEALDAHGESWTRYATEWGVSRAAMARWGDYPSLLEGAEPRNSFAAERLARMAEAKRFLASRMPEYVALIKIHEHVQRVRGRIYPQPETAEFMRTLAVLGHVGRSVGMSRAEEYRGFSTRVAHAKAAEKAIQATGVLRRLPLIMESLRQGRLGCGRMGWTVAVSRRLLPDLFDRLKARFASLVDCHQQRWHELSPLEALIRGAKPTETLLWSWSGGFPRERT